MKIFERNSKINFIDENNLLLGYDLSQSCCEDAGWFIADQIMTLSQRDDNQPEDEKTWSGWVFDPDFCKHIPETEYEEHVVVFRIIKEDEEKFVHLFNVHNGYYSHNFHFQKDKTMIVEDYI